MGGQEENHSQYMQVVGDTRMKSKKELLASGVTLLRNVPSKINFINHRNNETWRKNIQ